ncbi:MAG: TIGR04219 family outer membrane beta-barrel protein [Desulfatitalea sp.]
MLRQSVLVALLIWVGSPSAVQAAGVELALGAWQQNPSGDFSYKAVGPEDLLNVEDDLRYDTENRVQGRVKIDMPAFFPNIYLMAAPTEFEATGQKDVDFSFGDQTFQGSIPFFSKFTFNQYDVALYYGVPFIRTATLGKLNVDLGINVRIVDLEVQVRQESTSLEESYDIVVAVPQVYIAAQLTPVEWLGIEGEGRGIAINDNAMYSLIGRLRFKLFGPAFIAGGYRYDIIDVDEDDVVADFTIQGPFAEVGLKF